LAEAFGAGALVTLVTVYFASRRTARMSIPAAIRNLPEPADQRAPRRWQQVAKVAAAVAGLAAIAGGVPVLRLLGGIVVVLVVSSFLRGRLPERVHARLTGLVLA